MKEKEKFYNVEILTDCFCKIGEGKPEIRGTSIRGMIREWTKLLHGNPDEVWGGMGGKASKVGIAVVNICNEKVKSPLLPHKAGTSPLAIKAGASFDLVLTRLVGCTDQQWETAKLNVKNWLLIGCLGQRANRAAGSVWNSTLAFESKEKFLAELKAIRFILVSNEGFDNSEAVRTIASDTVNNSECFGCITPRTPSPVKMKVIKIADKFHLLLFAERFELLRKAISLLNADNRNNENWRKVTFDVI